jgi:hypothetical protein
LAFVRLSRRQPDQAERTQREEEKSDPHGRVPLPRKTLGKMLEGRLTFQLNLARASRS